MNIEQLMKQFAFLAVVAGLALIVAACSETSTTSSETDTSTATDESIDELVRASDTPPVVRPGLGGRPDGIRFDIKQWRTDFTNHTVPLDEFWQAVPLKDGIPSLDEPAFVGVADAASWLDGLEPVVEVEIDGIARAYPLQLLMWHEIVNDMIEAVPIVVTFCPLCYTALAFDRRLDGDVLEFGVSGNLRNSDLVMYDRKTESWWQQFNGEALVGELAGSILEQVPAAIVAFDDFSARNPDGHVLSRDTGHDLPYGYNPYVGYDRIDRPVTRFHSNSDDDRLLPRARVVLLDRGGETVVVPFAELESAGRIEVEIGGERLEVRWVDDVRSALGDPSTKRSDIAGSADVRSLDTDQRVAFDTPFWFAVAAFRPDVRIVTGP